MEKMKFRIADGTECQGYLFTWEGLSFGLTRDREASCNNWCIIELQTGCSVISKRLSTRKEAIKDALELLNSKGVASVKKRLKEIFVERGNIKVKGKIKTAHCTAPENRLKALCGRIKDEHCLPAKYFRCAKRPCKKCQRLAQKKRAG